MSRKMGRKTKAIINKRFVNCVVLRKAGYSGNNLQYEALCDCGQIFFSSGQRFRAGTITSCPDCRGRKKRESKEVELAKRLEKLAKINIVAVKYTLMDPAQTHIKRSANGIHAYFDKSKAQKAARVIGAAVVVPLSEALTIQNT